jgi:hypothetical protein
MRLSQDNDMTDWAYFAKCVNERFGPPTRCNPLGELASLRKTGTVDENTERFLALWPMLATLTRASKSTSTPPGCSNR